MSWKALRSGRSLPVDDRGFTYSFGFIGLKHLGAGQSYLMTIPCQCAS
jgi:hypothetical protein